jgi:hypothetical protein
MLFKSRSHERSEEHEDWLLYFNVVIILLLEAVESADLFQNLHAVFLRHLEIKKQKVDWLDGRTHLGFYHRPLDYPLCPIDGILPVDTISNFFLHANFCEFGLKDFKVDKLIVSGNNVFYPVETLRIWGGVHTFHNFGKNLFIFVELFFFFYFV